jgi:hypothetical protein
MSTYPADAAENPTVEGPSAVGIPDADVGRPQLGQKRADRR